MNSNSEIIDKLILDLDVLFFYKQTQIVNYRNKLLLSLLKYSYKEKQEILNTFEEFVMLETDDENDKVMPLYYFDDFFDAYSDKYDEELINHAHDTNVIKFFEENLEMDKKQVGNLLKNLGQELLLLSQICSKNNNNNNRDNIFKKFNRTMSDIYKKNGATDEEIKELKTERLKQYTIYHSIIIDFIELSKKEKQLEKQLKAINPDI